MNAAATQSHFIKARRFMFLIKVGDGLIVKKYFVIMEVNK